MEYMTIHIVAYFLFIFTFCTARSDGLPGRLRKATSVARTLQNEGFIASSEVSLVLNPATTKMDEEGRETFNEACETVLLRWLREDRHTSGEVSVSLQGELLETTGNKGGSLIAYLTVTIQAPSAEDSIDASRLHKVLNVFFDSSGSDLLFELHDSGVSYFKEVSSIRTLASSDISNVSKSRLEMTTESTHQARSEAKKRNNHEKLTFSFVSATAVLCVGIVVALLAIRRQEKR